MRYTPFHADKSNQEAREQRLGGAAKAEGSSVTALAAWESGPRPVHHIEESTNLYLINLPLTVNEESLGLFFARMGPVATVKIMWREYARCTGLTISSRQ